MPTLAIFIGILLDILGIAGYMATGSHHPSALIPAVLGTLLIILGIVALRNPWLSKHAMHGAAALAALGLLGGAARALPNLSKITSNNQLTAPGLGTPSSLGGTVDQFGSPTGLSTGTLGMDTLGRTGTLDHSHLAAFWTQAATALLSLAFLIFCLRSFLDARNNRNGSTAYTTTPPYGGKDPYGKDPYNKDRMP